MSIADHLPGVLWSGFMGLVIGNFATSPIYRLPRNASLFVQDPYCDTCHARLTPGDLFPVLSWLASRGKCRHCGARIPGMYALTEMLCGLLFLFCYLTFGFSEQFLLISLGMTSLLTLAVMLFSSHFFSDKTGITCIIFGALHRTLQDATIYGFAGGAFAGLLAGVLAWKLSGRPMVRDAKAFPVTLKLLVIAGVWLNLPQLLLVVMAAALSACLKKNRPQLPEWTIIICTAMLTLFYSHVRVSL